MDNLKQTLCEVYELLKCIPVSGDAVDAMYAVRAKMRQAYQIVETIERKDDENAE